MTTAAINAGFDLDLKDMLPRLRIYALSLTRDSDRADDLVQQTALRALAGRASFRDGSNFSGWIFRIQRDEFISELRRNRPTVELDSPAAYAAPRAAAPGTPLALRELRAPCSGCRAMGVKRCCIPDRGLFASGDRQSRGNLIGTVKSRPISRGRTSLARLLDLPLRSAADRNRARPILQTVNA